MSPDWGSLPLLPLRCILDHLSTEDAMAAMSACRHWRSAVLLFEGRKDCLKLEAHQLDKCLYLTRLFRKYTKKLHIFLDCNEEELDKFMSYVLPQYFDTLNLSELVLIGPRYIQLNSLAPVVKLKRIIIETLIHKNFNSLRKIAFHGCEFGEVKNENDRFTHKHIEYYSRGLSFPSMTPADAVLMQANASLMHYSTLRRILVDYDQINTDALETLSVLRMFKCLSLNVINKEQDGFKLLDWDRIDAFYPNGLAVTINIIEMPIHKMDQVIRKVLQPGMRLTSLKVLYCTTVYQPLIEHVVQLYKGSIQELVWADCPLEESDPYSRLVRPRFQPEYEQLLNVNPFVLLCWQCKYLRRLVIHGYWVWQYDLLGFARLRKSLQYLEVSSLHARQDLFSANDAIVRVLKTDAPHHVHEHFVKKMNEYTRFTWKPIPWSKLHRGLRLRATPSERSRYIMHETMQQYLTDSNYYS